MSPAASQWCSRQELRFWRIAAREIGPAKSKLIEVDVSRFERWKSDLFGSGDAQRPIVAPPAPAAPKT
jgi:hypothetical protein